MFSKALFVFTAVALAVNAQNTTTSAPPATSSGTDAITPCIEGCVIPAAAQNNCTSMYVFPSSLSPTWSEFLSALTSPAFARTSNSNPTPVPAWRNIARRQMLKLLSGFRLKNALPVSLCHLLK
jgi:hypothetical protein